MFRLFILGIFFNPSWGLAGWGLSDIVISFLPEETTPTPTPEETTIGNNITTNEPIFRQEGDKEIIIIREGDDGDTENNFFTKDGYKNTIILCLSGLLLITILVFTVIAIVKWRRIREGIMKVDDNRDVYGTYYEGKVEYSEVVDSNPYYGS